MKYHVLYAEDSDPQRAIQKLTSKVSSYLKLGWIPCGGVSMSVNESVNANRYEYAMNVHVCQAIVEREESDE